MQLTKQTCTHTRPDKGKMFSPRKTYWCSQESKQIITYHAVLTGLPSSEPLRNSSTEGPLRRLRANPSSSSSSSSE